MAAPPPTAASTSDILPMEHLDITDPQEVTNWHERFDQYCAAKDIDPTKKISHYLTLVGKQAYRLLKDLSYPTTIATLSCSVAKTSRRSSQASGLRTFGTGNISQF